VDASIRVECSAGTYVRALADDLGQALGVGAHLLTLRRIRTGRLSVQDSISLDAICEKNQEWREQRHALQSGGEQVPFVAEQNAAQWRGFLAGSLVPVADLLGGVPTLRLSGKLEDRVRSGQHLRKGDLDALEAGVPDAFKEGDSMVLEDPEGACVVAVVRAACASASLVRRDPSSVVFEVQRILR